LCYWRKSWQCYFIIFFVYFFIEKDHLNLSKVSCHLNDISVVRFKFRSWNYAARTIIMCFSKLNYNNDDCFQREALYMISSLLLCIQCSWSRLLHFTINLRKKKINAINQTIIINEPTQLKCCSLSSVKLANMVGSHHDCDRHIARWKV
jgi:hypothetical protein